MRFTRTAFCFLALGALSTFAVSAQVPATNAPVNAPAVNIPAGDDGWFTTYDLNTYLDFSVNPIPGGYFGLGSDPFAGTMYFAGAQIVNSGGLGPNTDTIVRRLANTGLISVGGCRTIPIDFQALHMQSAPFTVTYGGGASETWRVVAGLSTAAAQPIGDMTICRNCADGGTFSANLYAFFLNRYQRISPPPAIELQMDCGLGMCPVVHFQSTNSDWTLAGGPWGFSPTAYGVDALPAGVQLDVDADGILDAATTIGRTNFQGGVKLCGTPGYGGGGGGGGGAPECATADHVANNGGGDHGRSSHSNYVAATGDADGDGVPDHCVCPDEDGDGYNDDTGEPCSEEPHDDAPADRG